MDDKTHIEFMGKVLEGLGELRKGQEQHDKHLYAVSAKADAIRTELGEHKESIDAHGQKASHKMLNTVLSVATILIGFAALAVAWRGSPWGGSTSGRESAALSAPAP